jgi:ethanolamine utilization protein EutA (predicted chaperonin)
LSVSPFPQEAKMPEERIIDRVVIWIFFIIITPLNLKNEIKFDHQKNLVIGDRGLKKLSNEQL